MEIIFVCTAAIISWFLFSILFGVLNKSLLNVFGSLQRFTRKLKRKLIFEFILYTFLVISASKIKEIYSLNAISFGIVLGFGLALKDIIFEGGISY